MLKPEAHFTRDDHVLKLAIGSLPHQHLCRPTQPPLIHKSLTRPQIKNTDLSPAPISLPVSLKVKPQKLVPKWQPTPVLLLGKSHGQRSLVGYSPWDHKELDMTEQLSIYSIGFYAHQAVSPLLGNSFREASLLSQGLL